MEHKQAVSVDQPHRIEAINISIQSPEHGIRSENNLASTLRRRQRVPLALQSILRDRMSSKLSENPADPQVQSRSSKVGSAIRSRIKKATDKIKDVRHCEICEGQIPRQSHKKEAHLCECDHKRNFCESCLHHFVIYKVNTYEEVLCPREGCSAALQLTSPFFRTLPADIQKKYKKIYQFVMVSRNPDIRICPKQQCQGITHLTSENIMTCELCENAYCSQCLLSVHEGECDNHQVEYFEANLHYRQCKKCRFVVERSSGCNHMTCRCGYSFCYVCGSKWEAIHYNTHNQNGEPVGEGENAEECDCECMCFQEICGATCAAIIKLPIKLVLFLLFIPLMVLVWLSRDLLVVVGMFLVSVLAGLFAFSFELAAKSEGIMCFLAVLFFPVTMLAGVFVAFREIFCDTVPDMSRQYCDMCSQGARGICNM